MKIAENLVSFRKAASLSQKELAERLKTDRSTIAKYETGDREPNLVMLCKLADIYDVTTDELLGRKKF